jgi:hypothetical protein
MDFDQRGMRRFAQAFRGDRRVGGVKGRDNPTESAQPMGQSLEGMDSHLANPLPFEHQPFVVPSGQ